MFGQLTPRMPEDPHGTAAEDAPPSGRGVPWWLADPAALDAALAADFGLRPLHRPLPEDVAPGPGPEDIDF